MFDLNLLILNELTGFLFILTIIFLFIIVINNIQNKYFYIKSFYIENLVLYLTHRIQTN